LAATKFDWVLESGMKTIRTFVFVVIPVVCAACATQQPRTISALPEPPTAQEMQQLKRLPNGSYPGYQRIMVYGQEQFCRQAAPDGVVRDSTCLHVRTYEITTRVSLSESRVVCLTEAELRIEHVVALKQQLDWMRGSYASAPVGVNYNTSPLTTGTPSSR
jgi:hypothetical protein